MKQSLLTLVILLCVSLIGCASQAKTFHFAQQPPKDQEVYSALYHHMFARWKDGSSKLPSRFFLTCQSLDADAELLARFRHEGHDVFAGSRYRHGLGIQISFGKIEWASEKSAKVWGGHLFGPLGGSWGYFLVEEQNGVWIVLSWKPTLHASQPNQPPQPTRLLAFRFRTPGFRSTVRCHSEKTACTLPRAAEL